jgi:hypothetical protein
LTRTGVTAAVGPVDTAVVIEFGTVGRRQEAVFQSELAAGAPIEAAAHAAGLDPRRIPVRLAHAAPEILAGIPHTQLVEWEREDRIPTGTAAIAQATRTPVPVASRPSNRSRPSHAPSHSQLSLAPDIDGPAR